MRRMRDINNTYIAEAKRMRVKLRQKQYLQSRDKENEGERET
jgi:hypothetical protein